MNPRNTSAHTVISNCSTCRSKACADGKDCFRQSNHHKQLYSDSVISRLHEASSAIEARYYCQETRLSETMLFAQELGFKKIGLAFCIGLSEEARTIADVLSQHFVVISVCCKVAGINKRVFHLEHIRADKDEVMCNPAGQAAMLNRAGTELNILCGLCVGHDAIFTKFSEAPVTTLVVKDRVLAHNPLGAIYCKYLRMKVPTTS